jgi:hypothetical protein
MEDKTLPSHPSPPPPSLPIYDQDGLPLKFGVPQPPKRPMPKPEYKGVFSNEELIISSLIVIIIFVVAIFYN